MKETEKPFIGLKVAEALTRMSGRAPGPMGPEDLERLEAAVGGTVEVEGKRKALSARSGPPIQGKSAVSRGSNSTA